MLSWLESFIIGIPYRLQGGLFKEHFQKKMMMRVLKMFFA